MSTFMTSSKTGVFTNKFKNSYNLGKCQVEELFLRNQYSKLTWSKSKKHDSTCSSSLSSTVTVLYEISIGLLFRFKKVFTIPSVLLISHRAEPRVVQ